MLHLLPLLLQTFSEQMQLLGSTFSEASLHFLAVLLLISCVLLLGPHFIAQQTELPIFNYSAVVWQSGI